VQPAPFGKLSTLLLPLLAIRLVGALQSPIPDCDEVFNYWEQTHYLLHREGLQTWEYSPEFAIRSYFYCAMHALIAGAAGLLLGSNRKVAIFYCVRCALGSINAVCEAHFARRVGVACGTEVGVITWLLLLTSAGMFHAAVAFVPSSFAMTLLMCAWTSWLGVEDDRGAKGRHRDLRPGSHHTSRYARAIWAVAAGTLLGWPFAGIVGAGPLALDALFHLGLLPFLSHAVQALCALVLPSALFDSYLYGRPVVAFLNILLYNSSAKQGAGAQLYGVEPWHYYLHNLALNFNLALPAALAAPLLLLLGRFIGVGGGVASSTGRLLLVLSGFFLWLGFFSCIPHKEERFMFPVYPLLCLAAALAIVTAARILCASLPRLLIPSAARARRARFLLAGSVVAMCATISAMRAAGQVIYYGAPLRLYSRLFSELARADSNLGQSSPVVVCTGNEWYRFPSSFSSRGGQPCPSYETAFVVSCRHRLAALRPTAPGWCRRTLTA
jgi:alpha-1,2-mannosyltransferase